MDVPPGLILLYAFIIGICVGSFLNVVIYRLPHNISIVKPGSHCPECGEPILARDNIPLLGWVLLFGLCRGCGATISFRYFLVELLTGVITALVIGKYGLSAEGFIYSMLAWCLVAITFIDLDFQIIPDELSIGAIIAGLLLSYLLPIGFTGSVIGLLVGGGLFFTLATLYPGGMGGGDIKLIAAIGAFTGWKLTLFTIIVSSLLGSIIGIVAMAMLGKSRKDRIPFGPFLALGAIIAILWGEQAITTYLNTLD